MNRRAFLGLSSAALAAFTLDPERALWVPGQRSYFDIVRPNALGYVDLSGYVLEYRPVNDKWLDCATIPGLENAGPVTISGLWIAQDQGTMDRHFRHMPSGCVSQPQPPAQGWPRA
jgi:hypothetical protein